ncbi:hypothetical protein JHK86_010278 [Glycine max]|nr:hypothetical protein JHK86_010278 [Glycine max]
MLGILAAKLLSNGKLQELIENSGQSSSEAFQTMFGKEKPGKISPIGATDVECPGSHRKNERPRYHRLEQRMLNSQYPTDKINDQDSTE